MIKNNIKKCKAPNLNCLNCAFLCKLHYSVYSELDKETRKKLKDGDPNVINPIEGFSASDVCRLACYKARLLTTGKRGPWVQGSIVNPIEVLDKTKCEFHHPYDGSENIFFDAIEQKQVRAMEIENAMTAKRTLKVSQIGLIISLLAIAVAIIIGIIQVFE